MIISEKLPINVLIVDDDKTTLSVLKSMLSQYVGAVYLANNVLDAVDLYKRVGNIDVVITDLNMPHGGGLALLKTLKIKNPSIIVLGITADNNIGNIVECMKAGFSNIIKKPVDLAEIYSQLASAYELIVINRKKNHNDRLFKEYQKAMDSGFMVSKTDINGIITYANDTFCQISGYLREELVGKPHNIVRHPKMQKSAFADMWQTILNKKVWKGKVINRRKDGTPYYVSSVISPILDENDNIIEFISMRQDITKLVEANQKLLKEQEERAEKAKQHYEEMEKSKMTLLNLFSHELKTPLNAITNLSKILLRKVDSVVIESEREDSKELLGHISENADNMEQMIGNIVDVMKLQSGFVIPDFQKLPLAAIIFDKLEFVYKTKNKTLIYDVYENCSMVEFDQKIALKVLDQIMSNAIKYSKNKIKVSYTENGNEFCLTIEDDGNGFANPNMKIELFAQNDNNFLTRQSTGIGIGLYHAKLCAQVNNWNMHISNGCGELCGGCVKISGKLKQEKK